MPSFLIVTLNGSLPTTAQIEAGKDAGNANAEYADNHEAVVGINGFTVPYSELVAGTTYYWFLSQDAPNDTADSNILSGTLAVPEEEDQSNWCYVYNDIYDDGFFEYRESAWIQVQNEVNDYYFYYQWSWFYDTGDSIQYWEFHQFGGLSDYTGATATITFVGGEPFDNIVFGFDDPDGTYWFGDYEAMYWQQSNTYDMPQSLWDYEFGEVFWS